MFSQPSDRFFNSFEKLNAATLFKGSDRPLEKTNRQSPKATNRSSQTSRTRSLSSSLPWSAEYFGDRNFSRRTSVEAVSLPGQMNFSKNWGNGSPWFTPVDNFTARFTAQRSLAPGLYHIQVQADDGVRVRMGNQTVINQWLDQAYSTSSGYFRASGGTVPITVDYYEAGGTAAIDFKVTPVAAGRIQDWTDARVNWATNVFRWDNSQSSQPSVNFWQDAGNLIGTVKLDSSVRTANSGAVNFNWGQGAVLRDGTRLPHDSFAIRSYTWADFDGGAYRFRVRGDDGFQLLAKQHGTNRWEYITPQNQWNQAYGNPQEIVYSLPAGRWDLHFHYYENGGDANFDLSWEKVQDRLTQLVRKPSSLTVDEIREYRNLVNQRPSAERSSLFRQLQYKTPYFNQRDNGYTSIADVMCNVTSLASCLTALGVKNPNPNKQFEDSLEDMLRANPSVYPSSSGINARYWWSNLTKLAGNLGVASSGVQKVPGFASTNTTFIRDFARNNWEPALNQGRTIMAGVATTVEGHIVRVIDVDWNRGGLVVDDPFGRAQDKAGSDYKRYGYSGTENSKTRGVINTQQGQDESGLGNDNFWSWSYCAEVFGETWYTTLG